MSDFSMFKYGKKAGWLGVATIVLALVPVVLALIVIPGLPDEVPMRWNAAGEVSRWGSRFELLIPSAMSVGFGFGIYIQTIRKCAEHAKSSMVMAVNTAERFMLSGVITTGVINVVNLYLLFVCLTGKGPLTF